MAGGGMLNIAARDKTFEGTAAKNTLRFDTSDFGEAKSFTLPPLSGKHQNGERISIFLIESSDLFYEK